MSAALVNHYTLELKGNVLKLQTVQSAEFRVYSDQITN